MLSLSGLMLGIHYEELSLLHILRSCLRLSASRLILVRWSLRLRLHLKELLAIGLLAKGLLAKGLLAIGILAIGVLALLIVPSCAIGVRAETSSRSVSKASNHARVGKPAQVGTAISKPVSASPNTEQKRLACEQHDKAFAVLSNSQVTKAALEAAVGNALAATTLEPRNAAHWFLAGLLYEKLSAQDARALPMAEKMLSQAVEIDPEYGAAWLELGLMMAAQNRGMEAISALECALEADPAATATYAVGPLCAVYATNDEGLRGLDFFQEQYEANPEITAFGVGEVLMLNYLGDRKAALAKARDLVNCEQADASECFYLANLIRELESNKP